MVQHGVVQAKKARKQISRQAYRQAASGRAGYCKWSLSGDRADRTFMAWRKQTGPIAHSRTDRPLKNGCLWTEQTGGSEVVGFGWRACPRIGAPPRRRGGSSSRTHSHPATRSCNTTQPGQSKLLDSTYLSSFFSVSAYIHIFSCLVFSLACWKFFKTLTAKSE